MVASATGSAKPRLRSYPVPVDRTEELVTQLALVFTDLQMHRMQPSVAYWWSQPKRNISRLKRRLLTSTYRPARFQNRLKLRSTRLMKMHRRQSGRLCRAFYLEHSLSHGRTELWFAEPRGTKTGKKHNRSAQGGFGEERLLSFMTSRA